MQRKLSGPEKSALGQADVAEVAFHEVEYNRLRAELEQAYIISKLPDALSAAVSELEPWRSQLERDAPQGPRD